MINILSIIMHFYGCSFLKCKKIRFNLFAAHYKYLMRIKTAWFLLPIYCLTVFLRHNRFVFIKLPTFSTTCIAPPLLYSMTVTVVHSYKNSSLQRYFHAKNDAKIQFTRLTYVRPVFQLDQEFKRLDVPNTEELRKKHMRSWIGRRIKRTLN